MIDVIKCVLPQGVLTNEELVSTTSAPWSPTQIYSKTGIRNRHILGRDEKASDLAFAAAEFLLKDRDRKEVDFILNCTEAPDYILPSTACVLQHKLGLRDSCGALDYNLGCSGYVYGLAMASSLISSNVAGTVLLLTSDAYSKMMDPADYATRALFGDAASATLLRKDSPRRLHSFSFGTDGGGAAFLINRAGGFAGEAAPEGRDDRFLYMNGPEIFNFTLRCVPSTIERVLAASGLALGDVDHFIFHQANVFMLEHLRKRIGIPKEKMPLFIEDTGNTVSSTIPLCIEDMQRQGRLKPGDKCMLVGFGVGLSWAGCILEW